MNKKIKLLTALGMLLIFASCGHKEEDKKPAPPPIKYNTMTLQTRKISSNIQLPGVMVPFQFVQIFPKISGFIKDVYVDRGSIVKKGQLLITLVAPEIEQDVAAAHLKYTQAESDYLISKDRYIRLRETSETPGTISVYDLEAARSKMQADSALTQGLYANYKAEEAMRQYLTIQAPFDGVITERNVHPGAIAGPGTQDAKPMLILNQLSKLRLTADVPEQYAEQVQDGDMVHFRVNALPGQDFTGAISRSSHNLSSNYRSETIEIDVLNPNDVFKPGMYAEIVFPTSGNADAFVVPKSAVVTTTEKKYVIADNNNTAKWVDVTEGNQSADSTEIFGNLNNGEAVVVNAGYQIKDGQQLAVQ